MRSTICGVTILTAVFNACILPSLWWASYLGLLAVPMWVMVCIANSLFLVVLLIIGGVKAATGL